MMHGFQGKYFTRVAQLLMVLGLCACSQQEIKDSGPSRPLDFSGSPDAIPKQENRTRAGNKSPYVIFGKTYRVLSDSRGFRQQGEASWYGKKFHGRNTSNGEVYDMYAMTAAHKTLPIPSYVRVTNHSNGRSVVVRVNDRGPFHGNRIIDLSYAAASKLGFAERGTAPVSVEAIDTGNPPLRHAGVVHPGTAEPTQEIVRAPSPSSGNRNAHLGKQSYLQVAAFSQRQSAEQLLARLRSSISEPMRLNQAKGLFRVHIGPLTKVNDIAAVRKTLQALSLGSGFVVNE
ncbi:rare lipoprotein A [Pseudoteredinibacter isoporae]|uniref:Endolytic peptidoglycan transglycosylase RlpA n=2 Tax=Pseudoteredinibacter isoporae TaxID=570281 RepID=A0A7X0MZA8_9GAMM|nr:septal ring lytic transglycosylase RlpA family protein [Pseudoteredinibacter isoporae]MBB6522947.1 rare lipoprotein A [Pseudoteredinibacter isoporae]